MSAGAAGDAAVETVREWFARWGECVASKDFETARTLFDPAVLGFGTYADVLEGLDALEARQWRAIWPTIEDFRFELDGLRCLVSPDGLMATGIAAWGSTGIDAGGARFDRPGRASVVLVRDAPTGPWRGVHTHFSRCPGERKESFG